MTDLPSILESGDLARLIPVIADSRREQRVASVFLATLSAVPDLAQPLLGCLGVRLGKRSIIDTYTEVVIKGQGKSKDRPDGFVVVSSGKKEWRALVEAKIGKAQLEQDQVERYLQLARDHNVDAVITISNQFVGRPDHNPVSPSKVLTRRVKLFHWSWKLILTEAILLQTRDAIADPDQAFILREFVRFLSHNSVGVAGFEQMPPAWKELMTLVKSGGPIRKTAAETEEVISSWHQETRDLGLRLSQHLATDIVIKLPRAHESDLDRRLKDDCGTLADNQMLEVAYSVPNAASSLNVCADLKSQTIRVGMEVDAPQDRKSGAARVNWLLRQLKQARDDNLFVRIRWPSRAQDTVCTLSALREDPKSIFAEMAVPPRSFEVFKVTDDTRRFAGRRTFIEEVERAVPHFYDQVGQHLKRWVPSPPRPVSKGPSQPAAVPTPEKSEEQAPKVVETSAKPTEIRPGNRHQSLLDLPDFLRRVSGK